LSRRRKRRWCLCFLAAVAVGVIVKELLKRSVGHEAHHHGELVWDDSYEFYHELVVAHLMMTMIMVNLMI